MADTVQVTVFHARRGVVIAERTMPRDKAEKELCVGRDVEELHILRVTWSADRKSVSIDVS